MATLYQRAGSEYWYAQWTDPVTGKTYRRSTKTSDKRAANAYLVSMQREGALDHLRPREVPALDRLLDNYLATVYRAGTLRCYVQAAANLRRLSPTLDKQGLQQYVAARRQEGVVAGTVHKELVVLRQALKYADLPVDYVPRVRSEYVPRKTYLTRDQVRALLVFTPRPRQPWVLLAVYTGANLSELLRLTWGHFDWQTGLVRIPGTKRNSRDRVTPLHTGLRDWVYAYYSVLPTSGPCVAPWKNMTRDLALYCEKAKVPRVTSNDLRRTFASWLKQAGVDNKAVADLMGHKSTRMVDAVYGQLNAQTYREAISKLGNL